MTVIEDDILRRPAAAQGRPLVAAIARVTARRIATLDHGGTTATGTATAGTAGTIDVTTGVTETGSVIATVTAAAHAHL